MSTSSRAGSSRQLWDRFPVGSMVCPWTAHSCPSISLFASASGPRSLLDGTSISLRAPSGSSGGLSAFITASFSFYGSVHYFMEAVTYYVPYVMMTRRLKVGSLRHAAMRPPAYAFAGDKLRITPPPPPCPATGPSTLEHVLPLVWRLFTAVVCSSIYHGLRPCRQWN